jgi:hypothetical protein
MPDQTRVLALLEELQAAEHAGAAALGRWTARCQDPVLRGGLRVVRARDVAHAALALERLRQLGGSPGAPVAPSLDALCGFLAADGPSDRAKLGALLARFPSEMADPFAAVLGVVEDDDETHTLLRGLRDDDRLSLDWLRGIDHLPPVVPRERLGVEEHANIVAFLGALRAALEGATEVAHAWAHACALPGLRGALRSIAARTHAHATVVGERLTEIGGQPAATVLPRATLAAAQAWYGGREIGDERKLAMLLDRPTSAAAVEDFAAHLVEDVETREILRLTAAGEAATITWLAAYRGTAEVAGRAETRRVGSSTART